MCAALGKGKERHLVERALRVFKSFSLKTAPDGSLSVDHHHLGRGSQDGQASERRLRGP
jgi:hypothetical protein